MIAARKNWTESERERGDDGKHPLAFATASSAARLAAAAAFVAHLSP